MPRQYAKSAGVRRHIVEACAIAFSESGFQSVSMAEIARRAGISHTGLLHHFPRKEDLLTAVLDLQDERSAEILAAETAGQEHPDPVAVLRGILRAQVEGEHSVGLAEMNAKLIGEATSTDHPAHEHFADRYNVIRNYLTAQYAQLRDEDRLTGDLAPEQYAVMTIALADGLRTQWLYARDDIFLEQTINAVLGQFIPELTTQDALLPARPR